MNNLRHKLVFFVPRTNTKDVLKRLFEYAPERIGKIGNYESCAFITPGIGQFIAGNGSHPATGQVGRLEEVEEDRVEITIEGDVQSIVRKLKEIHPYEEVPIDIYGLC